MSASVAEKVATSVPMPVFSGRLTLLVAGETTGALSLISRTFMVMEAGLLVP